MSTTPAETPPRRSFAPRLSPSRIPRRLSTEPIRGRRFDSASQLHGFESGPPPVHPPSPPDTDRSASPMTERREVEGSPSRYLSASGESDWVRQAARGSGLSGALDGGDRDVGVLGLGYQQLGSGGLRPRSGPTFLSRQRLQKGWLLHVVPPAALPHSPPPAQTSGFAQGYGASGRYAHGVLHPLQSSLGAQIALIAREYSLPSVAGVSLYLSLSHPQAGFKPRISDVTWSSLWSAYLEGEGEAQGLSGVGGFPIAARIEFDVDPQKARSWLPAWTTKASESEAQQRPRPASSIFYNHTSTAMHSRNGTSSTENEVNAEASPAHRSRSSLSSPVLASPSSRLPRGRRPPSVLVDHSAAGQGYVDLPPAPAPSRVSAARERTTLPAPLLLPSHDDSSVIEIACETTSPLVLAGTSVQLRDLQGQSDATAPQPVLEPPPSTMAHALHLDVALPLPSYPSFAHIYPSVYPHLRIYPSLTFSEATIDIPRKRRPTAPAPLVLRQSVSLGSSVRSGASLSPLANSPERLPSVSLEERIMGSPRFWRSSSERSLPASHEENEENEVAEAPSEGLARDGQSVRDIGDVLSPTGLIMNEYEEGNGRHDLKGSFGDLVFEEQLRGESTEDDENEALAPPIIVSALLTPPHSPSLSGSSIAASPTLNAEAINRFRTSLRSAEPLPASSLASHAAAAPVAVPTPHVDSDVSPTLVDSTRGAGLSSSEGYQTRSEETLFDDGDGDSGDDDSFDTGYLFERDGDDTEATGEQHLLLDSSFNGEDDGCITYDHLSPVAPPLSLAPILFTFPSEDKLDELGAAAAQFLVEAQANSIKRRGRFTIALGGADIAEVLASNLVGDDRVDWRRWEVFFASASLDESDTTFETYNRLLFSRVPIPAWQIHAPVSTNDDLTKRAAEYEAKLLSSFPECAETLELPRFDLILLSLGADGRWNSLPPNDGSDGDEERWIVPVASESLSHLTFSRPLLSASRRLAIICRGEGKAAALANSLSTEVDSEVSAERIVLAGHPVVWFADEEAASGLQYPRSDFWEEEE